MRKAVAGGAAELGQVVGSRGRQRERFLCGSQEAAVDGLQGRQHPRGAPAVGVVGALVGRQVFLEQHHVHARVVAHGLDDLQHVFQRAVEIAVGVQGIADGLPRAQEFLEAHARFRRELRQRHPVPVGGVLGQAAHPARVHQHADALALGLARVQQHVDHVHGAVGALHPDDAGRTGDGVEGFHPAGQGAGVGQRGAAAALGHPHLEHHHRLAGVAGGPARGEKIVRPPHRLHQAEDQPHLRVGDEVADVVRGDEPGLVAAGDHVAHVDAPVHERARDAGRGGAALANHGHGAGDQFLHPVVRQGQQTGAGRQVAEAVGPGNGEAGVLDGLAQIRLQRAALRGAGFGEAGGVERGAAGAHGRGLAQNAGDAGRGPHHHQVVGNRGKRAQVGKALYPPDALVVRVHRIDRAVELEADQVGEDARRPPGGVFPGAQDGHAGGIEQCRDLVGAHGSGVV